MFNYWDEKYNLRCTEGRLKSKFPYFFLGVLGTYEHEIAGRYNF